MLDTPGEIESFTAQPTGLSYRTGDSFEVSFDNGISVLATTFPEQVVSAAYWLRGFNHPLQVEFDSSSNVIHRIGGFLTDHSLRQHAPRRESGWSRSALAPAIPACINDVATQSGPASSIVEVFAQTGQGELQLQSTDPVVQLLVETAMMRGKAPLLSFSPDLTLLGVQLRADASSCQLTGFSNVGDIAYSLPDAAVTVASDATVFRTDDPIILGVLATAKASGKLLEVIPSTDDPRRIRRVMRTSAQNEDRSTRIAAISPGACMDFLSTDLDDGGKVVLIVATDLVPLGITCDPMIQVLCHRALVGRLLVDAVVDDANHLQSITVSHLGVCD